MDSAQLIKEVNKVDVFLYDWKLCGRQHEVFCKLIALERLGYNKQFEFLVVSNFHWVEINEN